MFDDQSKQRLGNQVDRGIFQFRQRKPLLSQAILVDHDIGGDFKSINIEHKHTS